MYQYHILPNGLKIVFRQTDSRVAYSGVYINVGSRDEVAGEEGAAHFIEHSIFKGTEHRRAYHIQNRIDGVGGELNAFTTKEETCIYASSLSEHIERCLELFSDVLFHSVFPEHEIENEKDVVIEEINSYRDQPSDLIFDEFEELVFQGHPLAHNILGTKKNVKLFTAGFLRSFLTANYTADRMVLAVVGNIGFDRLVRMAEKYFGRYGRAGSSPWKRTIQPIGHGETVIGSGDGRTTSRSIKPVPISIFNKTVNRHTHQVHLLLGCEAPSLSDERKVAFSLLNNIIGGPAMNSRLNVAVREKYGFCYTIESQYVPFSDTGLFYIYAGVDADAADRTIGLVMHEIERLQSQKLSEQLLRSAQRQYVGQMAINNDSGLNEMQSIGKAFMSYDSVDTIEEMADDIMAISASDLLDTAVLLPVRENFSCLCYR